MRNFLIMLAATGLGLSSFSSAADMTVQPLRSVDTSQKEGYSLLVRKEASLLSRIESSLPTDNREVWWLIFNNPEACETRPCAMSDIYRQETRADLIRASEDNFSQDGSGSICLRAGHGGRSLMPDLGMNAAGLVNIRSAEIQVIVAEPAPGLESLISRANGGFSDNCAGGHCSTVMVAVHTPRLPRLASASPDR